MTCFAALASLRSVLHSPATKTSWVHLCGLVDLMRARGDLDIALDYIHAHNPERWPASLRVRPWGWGVLPDLAELAAEPVDAAPQPEVIPAEAAVVETHRG